MRRDHLEFLKNWRKDPIRVPLLIRGARQVGKSWLVSLFGKEFSSYIEINFEKDKRVHALFPSHISLEKTLEQLQVYTQKKLFQAKLFCFWMRSRSVPTPFAIYAILRRRCPNFM